MVNFNEILQNNQAEVELKSNGIREMVVKIQKLTQYQIRVINGIINQHRLSKYLISHSPRLRANIFPNN